MYVYRYLGTGTSCDLINQGQKTACSKKSTRRCQKGSLSGIFGVSARVIRANSERQQQPRILPSKDTDAVLCFCDGHFARQKVFIVGTLQLLASVIAVISQAERRRHQQHA